MTSAGFLISLNLAHISDGDLAIRIKKKVTSIAKAMDINEDKTLLIE